MIATWCAHGSRSWLARLPHVLLPALTLLLDPRPTCLRLSPHFFCAAPALREPVGAIRWCFLVSPGCTCAPPVPRLLPALCSIVLVQG
jgi:hypothetical protein